MQNLFLMMSDMFHDMYESLKDQKKNKMDRDVQSRPLALAVAPGAVVTVVKCTSQQGVKINAEVRMGQFG